MIYCTTLPIERYVENVNGEVCGIYTVYGDNPAMLNLITRVTTLPFMYEPGFEPVPLGQRLGRLLDEHLLLESLQTKIGKVTFEHILNNSTPIEMFNLFMKTDPKLPLNDLYGKNNLQALAATMKLRCLQYRRHFRGTIKPGKVTVAQFRSNLTPAEDLFLNNSIDLMLKQYLGSIKKGVTNV